MDVWPTIGEGKPAPREEVVYDIEPFRAALRRGAWKLVWQATLPSQVELFNLAEDPVEKTNLAGENPEKVAELQQRIEALAREAVPPLILKEAFGAVKPVLFGSVALPGEEQALEKQP
jgi:arylsulfatase A-like enzyme